MQEQSSLQSFYDRTSNALFNNNSSRSLTKRSNSGVSVFEPAFEHAEDISNKNFRQAYCSIFLQGHSLTVPLLILDTSFFERPH